ncbi:SEC-C metal-binding domain-containing protein [Pseudomonas putida]|uniref:SEC-C metal-binding domain-containing protein n=1 Tax=Pseudomonas putida TaxID=303 RepID=UPI00370C8821
MPGIVLSNCFEGRVTNVSVDGSDAVVGLYGCADIFLDNINGNLGKGRRKFGRKVGRNEVCPCGSGFKFKKCICSREDNMSAGIRAHGSTFTVGKAKIVADVGVDMVNSTGHIDDLEFYAATAPALAELLKGMTKRPPKELVDEAIELAKKDGNQKALESSGLRGWCKDQGLTAAFWMELAASIAGVAASFK